MRSSHAMLRFCEGPASHWAAAGQQGVAADEGRRSRFALPLAFAAEHRYVGQTGDGFSHRIDLVPLSTASKPRISSSWVNFGCPTHTTRVVFWHGSGR